MELVNDHLETFVEAWENFLIAPESEPEDEILEGHYHRQLEKLTSVQNAFALDLSDQTHRKEPKSFLLKLKGMVIGVLQDQPQNSLNSSETNRAGERSSDCALNTAESFHVLQMFLFLMIGMKY